MNSFKMKTAVILGVAQMLLGTCMKGLNDIYFKKYLSFVFVVVTQIFLMLALFGFMDYMIIVKWLTDWSTLPKGTTAPGIINTMIVMFIQQGTKTDADTSANVIEDQTSTMRSLLVVALICVPSMLFVVPCIHSKTKAHVADQYEPIGLENEVKTLAKAVISNTQAHNSFGELFIHQMIETIEYVLGTVSNTASYLRLWALSLAHGQLAKVFFDYTLAPGLKS
jgi:V-type H+-transporting ATPase subunit a